MRVEDVDRGRTRPGAEEQMLRDLDWLGFDWDEGPDVGGPCGPYRQSERSDRYVQVLSDLGDRLFECSCSRKEIRTAAAVRPDHRGELRYAGTCRSGVGNPERIERSLRARIDPGEECWEDLWRGVSREVPSDVCGDFILRAKNGDFTYQLACTVDDLDMGVTHILRGEDLVDSTGRQLQLRRWLGAPFVPLFAHCPLRLDASGERLSKTRGSPSLETLRASGEDAGRLLGTLAWELGLVGEQGLAVRPGELVDPFIERMPQLLKKTGFGPI